MCEVPETSPRSIEDVSAVVSSGPCAEFEHIMSLILSTSATLLPPRASRGIGIAHLCAPSSASSTVFSIHSLVPQLTNLIVSVSIPSVPLLPRQQQLQHSYTYLTVHTTTRTDHYLTRTLPPQHNLISRLQNSRKSSFTRPPNPHLTSHLFRC